MFGLFGNKKTPFMKNSDAVLQKEEELIRLIKSLLEKHFGESFDVGFKKSYSSKLYTRRIEFKKGINKKLFAGPIVIFQFELESEETIKIDMNYFDVWDCLGFRNRMSKGGIIQINDIELFIKRMPELINRFKLFDGEYCLKRMM